MNGIDRVFVSALNTVKRLPTSPTSPKPPLEDRLLLYGLFKQSMEGDIPESMYDALSTPIIDEEDEANREKTEAWARQRGTSKTEAKRNYISTLIRSMRQYGSKTETARSLIDELEFVWNQVTHNDDVESRYSRSPSHEEEEEEEVGGLRQALPNVYRTAPPSPIKRIPTLTLPPSESRAEDERWKKQVEVSLQQIRAELASVRESLLLTSPSSQSLLALFQQDQSFMSLLLTRSYKLLVWSAFVIFYDLLVLSLVWYFFRRRGDARAKAVEDWVKNLWNWGVLKMKVRVRRGTRSIEDRR